MDDNWLRLPYMQNTILQDICTSQLGGFSVFLGGRGAVGGFTTQKYPLRKQIVKTFSTLTLAWGISKDILYMYYSGIFLSCFC